jgi:predicted DNA-binding protein (MmcQ/YjbR family)
MIAKRKHAKGAAAKLRALALRYPEAREDFPWGERVIKVGKKVFVFMGSDDGDFGISVKLPKSAGMALMLPFAEPTGYGLGKSGWVTASFGPKEKPPVPLLAEWIEESYRAVAPRNLVARLPAVNSAGPRTGRPGSGRTGGRSSRSTGRVR